MIKRISSINEVENIIDNNDVGIIGENWIVNLLIAYFKKLRGKDVKNIVGKKDSGCILVVDKELKAHKVASELEKLQPKHEIYYMSEIVKDKMDEALMKYYPSIYERDVLLYRKEELDHQQGLDIKKAIDAVYAQEKYPLFETIEIETINRCNGTCEFCPINRNSDTRKITKMSEDLFTSIISQLEKLNFKGRVNLFSNNEPLLDDRIIDFAGYTAKKLPYARKILFTNGTLMTTEIFREIISYVNFLCFDIYYDKSPEEKITKGLRAIFNECLDDKKLQEKVMVNFIYEKSIRNNRGGESKNRHCNYKVKSSCLLPFIQMIVRPNGKTSLCCNDPFGKMTLADLNEETLVEAWNNEHYRRIRSLIMGTRQNVDYCQLCDNFGTMSIEGEDKVSDIDRENCWKKIKGLLKK